MTLFKGKYRIESNRLQNWDYSGNGHYFITIVTENRDCIFGEIENNKLWQSNYHDHIIRNMEEYSRIKTYIQNNPTNWNKNKPN